ncbi:hypothetical protein MMC25_003131 [Agyrium rufum]|nr:hypothetical protein [Agyrium rufum]
MPSYFSRQASVHLYTTDPERSTINRISATGFSKEQLEELEQSLETASRESKLAEVPISVGETGQEHMNLIGEHGNTPFMMVATGFDILHKSIFFQESLSHNKKNQNNDVKGVGPQQPIPVPGQSNSSTLLSSLHDSGGSMLDVPARSFAKDLSASIPMMRGIPLDTSTAPSTRNFQQQPTTLNPRFLKHPLLKPRPLGMKISLTRNSFHGPLRENASLVDIKVDVYFNGVLCESNFYPSRNVHSNMQITQHVTGRRIGRKLQRPWMIVPPGQQVDGSLREHRRSKIDASQRWQQISQALAAQAGTVKYEDGSLGVLGQYLIDLSNLEMPTCVASLQKPGAARFGVIDLVVTAGKGVKDDSSAFRLAAPLSLRVKPWSSSRRIPASSQKEEFTKLDDDFQKDIRARQQAVQANLRSTKPLFGTDQKEKLQRFESQGVKNASEVLEPTDLVGTTIPHLPQQSPSPGRKAPIISRELEWIRRNNSAELYNRPAYTNADVLRSPTIDRSVMVNGAQLPAQNVWNQFYQPYMPAHHQIYARQANSVPILQWANWQMMPSGPSSAMTVSTAWSSNTPITTPSPTVSERDTHLRKRRGESSSSYTGGFSADTSSKRLRSTAPYSALPYQPSPNHVSSWYPLPPSTISLNSAQPNPVMANPDQSSSSTVKPPRRRGQGKHKPIVDYIPAYLTKKTEEDELKEMVERSKQQARPGGNLVRAKRSMPSDQGKSNTPASSSSTMRSARFDMHPIGMTNYLQVNDFPSPKSKIISLRISPEKLAQLPQFTTTLAPLSRSLRSAAPVAPRMSQYNPQRQSARSSLGSSVSQFRSYPAQQDGSSPYPSSIPDTHISAISASMLPPPFASARGRSNQDQPQHSTSSIPLTSANETRPLERVNVTKSVKSTKLAKLDSQQAAREDLDWGTPPLSEDCVITFAKDKVRQMRIARPGEFREWNVLLGVRFLVG